jgi:phosphoglycerate dehydrogenase-like enzyme
MSNKHPVLFLTDRSKLHQSHALSGAPPELDITFLRRPPRDELLRRLEGAEFLISERSGIVDAEMIGAGAKLRLIQRLGSLTHDIDLEAARQAGVAVASWPVMTAIMVAEHMMLQMLALAKRLGDASAIAAGAGDWGRPSLRTDEDTFAYDWSQRRGIRPLYEQTVGILGFGEIGAEIARRLKGFSVSRVLYHKRSRLPSHTETDLGLTFAPMEQVVAESDTLCMLLPFFPETDMLCNARLLDTMKPGAFLVSCGSGSVIDEAALAKAVRSRKLGGAALDTYEWEPIRPDNPLLPLARDPESNVLLTPHTAAGSSIQANASSTRQSDYTNILRVLRSQPLLHQVV